MDLTGLGSVFDFGSKVIDKIFPDPAERAKAQAALQAAKDSGRLQELEATKADEEERTERQAADMASDNWLSKNIRPLVLLHSLVIIDFMAFFDGNVGEFTVNSEYVNLYGSILLAAVGFYFSWRGIEKVMDTVRSWKVK